MKLRWLGRAFRPVTVATRAVFETLTLSLRPWNYAGVMKISRTCRHDWTDATSYDGLIEGIDEQSWWRSRMLKAAAVVGFEFMSARRRIAIHYAAGICIAVALVLGFCVILLVASRNAPGNLIASILLSLVAVMAISVVAVHSQASLGTASLPYLLGAVATYVLAAVYAGKADITLPVTLVKLVDVNSVPVATLCICTVVLSIGGAIAAITDLVGSTSRVRFLRRTASLYFPTLLMHVAAQLESDPECRRQGLTVERVRLVNAVYFVNSRIELVARNGSKVIDPLVRKALQSQLSGASLYLQSVALQIVMKSHQDERHVIHGLRRMAVCLLLQFYDHLPTFTPDNNGNLPAERRHRKLLYWLRWAAITLLPTIVIAAMQLLQITLPEIAVQWLTAFAVTWGLVRAISAMEPNYRATLVAARELLGDAPSLHGK